MHLSIFSFVLVLFVWLVFGFFLNHIVVSCSDFLFEVFSISSIWFSVHKNILLGLTLRTKKKIHELWKNLMNLRKQLWPWLNTEYIFFCLLLFAKVASSFCQHTRRFKCFCSSQFFFYMPRKLLDCGLLFCLLFPKCTFYLHYETKYIPFQDEMYISVHIRG